MRAEKTDTACDMPLDQKAEYNRAQGTLDAACKELLRLGSMKLFGTYFSTTLNYRDRPLGWDQHDRDVVQATRAFDAEQRGAKRPPPAQGRVHPSATGTAMASRRSTSAHDRKQERAVEPEAEAACPGLTGRLAQADAEFGLDAGTDNHDDKARDFDGNDDADDNQQARVEEDELPKIASR